MTTAQQTPFTQDEFEDALDTVGIFDADVTNTYSGRCMYGDQCFGVVTDGREALVGLAVVLAMATNTPDAEVDELVEQASELLRKVRGDSMGLGRIFYFPGYTLAEPHAEADDDDDEEV